MYLQYKTLVLCTKKATLHFLDAMTHLRLCMYPGLAIITSFGLLIRTEPVLTMAYGKKLLQYSGGTVQDSHLLPYYLRFCGEHKRFI